MNPVTNGAKVNPPITTGIEIKLDPPNDEEVNQLGLRVNKDGKVAQPINIESPKTNGDATSQQTPPKEEPPQNRFLLPVLSPTTAAEVRIKSNQPELPYKPTFEFVPLYRNKEDEKEIYHLTGNALVRVLTGLLKEDFLKGKTNDDIRRAFYDLYGYFLPLNGERAEYIRNNLIPHCYDKYENIKPILKEYLNEVEKLREKREVKLPY